MCQCHKCAHSAVRNKVRSCLHDVQFCTTVTCTTCHLQMAKCRLHEKETSCVAFIPRGKDVRRLCSFCINHKGGKCLVKKVG